MIPTAISIIGTVVLLLDVFAIVSVLLGSSGVMRKLLWIAVIILLPIVGMVLYLIGRTSADTLMTMVTVVKTCRQQSHDAVTYRGCRRSPLMFLVFERDH
jgi:hypothetical protein